MTQQTINIGTVANDGTGDPARTAFGKVNANFDELYSVGYIAPAATGVAATDTDALEAWINSAGVGAVLHLRPNNTYLIDRQLALLVGQKLYGHGAVLKRAAQAATTTDTDVTSGVTTQITVASVSGMRVGQSVTIQTGAATNYDPSKRTITDITGNVITVDVAFGLTSTNQINVYTTWHTLYAYTGCEVHGVEFDGNVANHAFGRWERTCEIRSSGSRVLVEGCYFHDLPGEGIMEGSEEYGYVDAGTNAITAGGTTATMTATPPVVANDFCILEQSPALEAYYHRVTDVTGNVVTIASPGWGFASSSGSVKVYKGATGCKYTSNTFHRLNGNGIHCGGTLGTKIVGNTFTHTNLDANVGHVGGGISLSAACPDVLVQGNHFENNYAAIGTVKRLDHSGLIFQGNTVAYASTYAIEAFYSGTDGYGPTRLVIGGNVFRNCAKLYVGTTGSTTDTTKFMSDISITGNQFWETLVDIQRVKGFTFSLNSCTYVQTANDTANIVVSLSQKSENVTISGNKIRGGRNPLKIAGSIYKATISGNSIFDGYREGIYVAASLTIEGLIISGNSVGSVLADAGNYAGIRLGTGTGVSVIGNTVMNDTGYACIRVEGSGAYISGNAVSNSNYNGSGRYEIRVETGLTGYVVNNNKTANVNSDVPGLSPISTEQLLFVKRAADLQSTADQAFSQWESTQITRYMVTRITAICKTGGATVACAGGIYTAASKGGTALVAAGQSWLNLSAANKIVQATLDAVNATDSQSAATLYFALTTGSTAAATADIFVYGTVLD